MKLQEGGELLWGVLVETEAYSQEEPACHGYRCRPPSNSSQALLPLKRSPCLNISAFCREAIPEKLERLEAVK